jgi:phosphonate transport system permease protein
MSARPAENASRAAWAPPGSADPAAGLGSGFEQTWQAERRRRRRRDAVCGLAFLIALAASFQLGQVRLDTFLAGLPQFGDYFVSVAPNLHFATLGHDLGAWYWNLGRWLRSLLDTLLMAIAATLLGFCGGLVLAMPASRNLEPWRGSRWAALRIAEFCRSIPELVSATIFVFAFGIGPFAGVLALALHSTGALGKLFGEVNENLEMGAADAVRASGGNWLQTVRYGVIPAAMPNYLSYTLLRFEINVRSATILGFVGAGGIGQDLMYVVREFLYQDVSAIVLLIIVVVFAIDLLSERLRHRVLGRETLA